MVTTWVDDRDVLEISISAGNSAGLNWLSLIPVHTCVDEGGGGHPFLRMYFRWSLCTLPVHACQVRVIVGDSGLLVVLVLRISSFNELPCLLICEVLGFAPVLRFLQSLFCVDSTCRKVTYAR